MVKSYKKIMPLLLTFALVASVFYAYQEKAEMQGKYDSALAQARSFAEKGIVPDAITEYKNALAIRDSFPITVEAGNVYLTYGEQKRAESWYNRTLLEKYPDEAGTYLYGMQMYAMNKNYASLFSVYDKCKTRDLNTKEIETYVDNFRYLYSLSGAYQDAGPFSAKGVAAVQYEGHWGYLDSSGKRKIRYKYDDAGVMGDYAAVVDQEGHAMYLDEEGNERINEGFIIEKDPSFGHVTRFGAIYKDMILAYNGKIWNYYYLDTFEKAFGGFASALPVANGIGAVSSNGDKWALISEDGTLLTDYVFDEVLTDQKEVSYRRGVLLVKRDGAYYLVDSSGNPVNSEHYSNARPFHDGTYAAVEKNGKWLFIDPDGKEYDLGNFDDARSFSSGLAAVQIDGLWGYINTTGELVIENRFYGCGPFATTGCSFVERVPGEWQLLSLYSYNH